MLAESLLIQKGMSRVLIKKVFNILVECLQNLDKHLDTEIVNKKFSLKTGCVCIFQEGSGISVSTANLVSNKSITMLKTKLNGLHNKSKEEIRKIYKDQLAMGRISEKGGAGLGFIDMARKSGQPFFFGFDKYLDEYSVFYIKFSVSN